MTILTAFWYDSDTFRGGTTSYPECQVLGAIPSQDARFESIQKRRREIAALFKNQSDVWFGVWNESYDWKKENTSSAGQWLEDAKRMTDNIRSAGVAKALLARLLRLSGDNQGAVRTYRSIEERWLQLHPQVDIERDKSPRNLGRETLDERENWLNQVAALRDEWVIERRVQLLIDKGDAAAKKLLLSVPFQKVHQTYSRTNVWFQICKSINEPCFPIPEQLGEDRLANFGAYREFE